MKKFIFPLLACLIVFTSFAQTTGRLENLKDAWGISYNYIGEIKNNKPHGTGVAIYTSGNALRYAGGFQNGIFTGKGVLIYSDATFLSGEWKDGKLNGKGASLNKDGDLFVGHFANGKKDGSGRFVYGDKSILSGSLRNDNYEGRCIFINASGMTLADNIYNNGKKEGSGYQYEMDTKKLFEGSWSGGNWVNTGTASYASFLKSNKFYSEKTDNQILIGCIDRNNKNLLDDTAFFYDVKNKNRYFGYYKNGFLSDGIVVKDSTRFFGKINDDGAVGICSFYKLGKFYDEGTYSGDYMTGSDCLSIDLTRKSVYLGGMADKGAFNGKGWFINNFNEVFVGNFQNGSFEGPGYIIFNTGKTVKGVYKKDVLTSITAFTDEKGAAIDRKPKKFETALNLVVEEFNNDLVVFKGEDATELADDDIFTAEKSIISFPGSVGNNFVFQDYDFYNGYNADFYKGKDFQAAKTQYEKLCKDINASSLRLKTVSTPVKPTGSMEFASEKETTRTKFGLQDAGLSTLNIYASLIYRDGEYTVSLVVGEMVYDD